MSEVRDPRIKLFGKTIELPEAAETGGADPVRCCHREPPGSSDSMLEDGRDGDEHESRESLSGRKQDRLEDEDQVIPLTLEELKDSGAPADTDAGSIKMSKATGGENETTNSQEKTLKKPDKILPCPRCNSMDTKFCYFNNYNVNQPRHFCKNCQRYWTAGGTMRNVPVGAGRRKNRNSVSQFRHLTVPEAINGIHHPALNPNGAVLTFGSDSPLRESMASVLNIADRTVGNVSRNRVSGSDEGRESGDDRSGGSSITAASSKDEVGKNVLPEIPFPSQVPCYPRVPWLYPWNPMQWNSTVSPPTFGPASCPLPFYATSTPPYWGCAVPGPWPVPWVIPRTLTASQGPTPLSSGPNSPTLGKHSRDDYVLKPADAEDGTSNESGSEKSLWVPKTLRIDDPREAAKSSIWATLGIKNDRVDPVGSGGLFKAFRSQSKGDEKTHDQETTTVLQANPAALSRSLNFHENS